MMGVKCYFSFVFRQDFLGIYKLVGVKSVKDMSSLESSYLTWASQAVLVVKNLPVSAGGMRGVGLIPGSRKSLGEGNGNPVQ